MLAVLVEFYEWEFTFQMEAKSSVRQSFVEGHSEDLDEQAAVLSEEFETIDMLADDLRDEAN